MLTRSEIEEWLRLAEAATPGPWTFYQAEENRFDLPRVVTEAYNDETPCICYGDDHRGWNLEDEDGGFIAASRTAVPALCRALLDTQARLTLALAEVRAARELVNREGVSRIGNSSVDARRYAEARAANEKAEGER